MNDHTPLRHTSDWHELRCLSLQQRIQALEADRGLFKAAALNAELQLVEVRLTLKKSRRRALDDARRIGQLEAALLMYGRHEPDCLAAPCTCGLDEARKPSK